MILKVVCKTWAGLNGLGSGLGSILTLCLNRVSVISGDVRRGQTLTSSMTLVSASNSRWQQCRDIEENYYLGGACSGMFIYKP